jgi:putative endonuclease
MPYFVYILQSEVTQKYYCGQTDNIQFRLLRHNNKEVKSTAYAVPWILVGYVLCESRSASMQLEKLIKKRGIQRWMNENSHQMIK